jgi:hypothetical protein
MLATRCNYFDASSCSKLSSDTNGDWFRISGSGQCLTAHVALTFGAIVALYKGEDCSSLSCVVQYAYSYGKVEWFARTGATYWIYIGGMSATDVGSYSLSVMVRSITNPFTTVFIFSLFWYN